MPPCRGANEMHTRFGSELRGWYAATPCPNGKHQNAGEAETSHQVGKTRVKGMCARDQVAHHQRADKASEISHGIDQANGCRGSRFAQKRAWYCPECRMKRKIAGANYGEQQDGEGDVRSKHDGHGECQSAQKGRNGGVPSALSCAIGMPAVDLLHQKPRKIRQSREQRHARVTLTGKALQNGREPECNAVISSNCEEVGERQQQDVAVAQRLPDGVGTTLLLRLFFQAQLLGDPAALVAPQPARLSRPVREVEGGDYSKHDRRDSFQYEQPSPSSQAQPGNSQ